MQTLGVNEKIHRCKKTFTPRIQNRLNLNPSKTQLIWFGTRQQLLKLDHKLIALTFPNFRFSSSVHGLGVTLDSELPFADHISLLTRSCYCQPRHRRTIRKSVSTKAFLTFVHLSVHALSIVTHF